MKHIIVIFAHPDDEAFGPSATLLKESRENGAQIHLICLTDGGDGQNPDKVPDLGALRRQEWQAAASLIGATTAHMLDFKDGHLSNHQYFEAVDQITAIVDEIIADATSHDSVEFMSGDFNGITGHLDHIFAARVAAYIFCNYKKADPRISRLRLVCIPLDWAPESNCDWLYMEAGRTPQQINQTVDARDYAEEVFAIMRAHHSQRADCEAHISAHGRDIGLNHFLVIE